MTYEGHGNRTDRTSTLMGAREAYGEEQPFGELAPALGILTPTEFRANFIGLSSDRGARS